jgi:hypothetical protein
MKVVFALFDSLNRKALEPYGGQAIATPNFLRLAGRAISFDRHYIGSMPRMSARRDAGIETRLQPLMRELMAAPDAPAEAYARLGLAPPAAARAS